MKNKQYIQPFRTTDDRIKKPPRRMLTKLGTRLWMLRNCNRLTQRELADLAGVSRKTIHAIEAGKTLPSLLVAMKIAAAMNMRVEELFNLTR